MCAVQGKNQVVSRKGFSANALVFGRQRILPDLLDDDAISSTTLGQALSTETEVARQAEMKNLAKRALLHQDAQQKLKNALAHKPGGQIKEFLPGEKIFFWVPKPKKGRYRKDHGEWRGPAVVIVNESHEKYVVSWWARCLLLAEANVRGATIEENMSCDLEEMQQLQGSDEGEKTYEDLLEIQKPSEEKEKDKSWKAQEDTIKLGNKFGRPRREAVEMMKGLRGVRRLLQSKFQKGRKRKGRSFACPFAQTVCLLWWLHCAH